MIENKNDSASSLTSVGINLTVPTTKILAIGSITSKGMVMSARFPVMFKEVPATVNLYLDGKIEQWYAKIDRSGVVFVMNVNSAEEARSLLEELPLGLEGMMTFEFIPLGPLSPLRFLLQGPIK